VPTLAVFARTHALSIPRSQISRGHLHLLPEVFPTITTLRLLAGPGAVLPTIEMLIGVRTSVLLIAASAR
jgi:hypothetical protein